MIGRYKWWLVALLWVVALLNYLDRQVIFAVFPLLQADLRVSSIQLGLLGTSFLWVYGILSPFGGYLADRFGRRRIILASLIGWSAITWLTAGASSYPELLGARGLMGISEACYLPAALALIADYHGPGTRSRAIGLHQSGLYAGIALGGIGGGWMGSQFGWRSAFLILGIIGVAYGAVLFFGLKESTSKKDDRPRTSDETPFAWSCRELVYSREFLIVVGVNCLASVAYWCVYTWLALYLYERFRMSLTVAGFSSTFYIQVASFAGVLLGGWLADSWAQSNPRGRALTQCIGLGAAGPFLFLAGTTGSRWTLLPCLVLFGLGRGFFDCNLMPVVCQIVSPKLRATAYGLLNFTSCLAGGAMAAAGGVLKDSIGLGGALQISAAMLMLGAVWLWASRIPQVRTHAAIEARA
ncbi:MAG TPA: MFS transporter [Bryobacteraceae bacterium]|jgi:predicted MFS family arabinose efflux permease|nr:MFS transporter [Bryobacteraceae bacterium]